MFGFSHFIGDVFRAVRTNPIPTDLRIAQQNVVCTNTSNNNDKREKKKNWLLLLTH